MVSPASRPGLISEHCRAHRSAASLPGPEVNTVFETLQRDYVSHLCAFLFTAAAFAMLGLAPLKNGASRDACGPRSGTTAATLETGGRLVQAAQATSGFPASRVRPPHLGENWQGSPEAYLLEARVVLRSFEAVVAPDGMRISGSLWSDFEVEAGHGLPAGQIQGLQVEVGLYQLASETDDKVGAVVPDQVTTVKIAATEDAGEFKLGAAEFALPAMAKPLPLGFYRLTCKLVFERQSDPVKNALMWVRDLYGMTADNTPIFGSKRHVEVWKDLIENEMCRSEGTLFIGRSPKNVLCGDASYEVYKNLTDLAGQRDELEKQYEIDKKNPGLNPARVKAAFQQSIKLLDTLQARAGGKMSGTEASAYSKTLAAMHNCREDILQFEDDLRLKYWIALDTFFYAFHSINKPGGNCARAIEKGDNLADRNERERRLQALRNNPPALKARDEEREKAFKFTPEPIKRAAYEYYRRGEETPDFDSATFTKKAGKLVIADPAKWSAFRVKFLAEFRKSSDASLASIDLSSTYSIQKWPEIFKEVVAVRDAIITHIYGYELYLRTQSLQKGGANAAAIKAEEMQCEQDWKDEAGDDLKLLEQYFPGAKAPPAAVYTRWDTATNRVRRLLKLKDYAYRFSLKIK